MKAKNLEVGLKVQVKDNTDSFLHRSYGKVGTITKVDQGYYYDVFVEFDDSGSDWGNHKDIRKYAFPFKVGDTVKVLEDGVGFYRESYGKVGTVVQIDEDSSLNIKVAFDDDDGVNDWGNHSGVELYVEPEPVEPSEPEPELKVGAIVQVRKTNRNGATGFKHSNNGQIGVVHQLDLGDRVLNARIEMLKHGGVFDWGNTDELVVLKEVDSNTPKGTRVVGIVNGLSCSGRVADIKNVCGTVEDVSDTLVGVCLDIYDGNVKHYMGVEHSMVRVLGE